MNEQETASLITLIRKMQQQGVTVLLIEHDMSLVMRVCEKIVVLEYGCKIAEGTPARSRATKRCSPAYLALSKRIKMLLQVTDLRVKYGNIEVLHGINLQVQEGEIVAIVGAARREPAKSTTVA